ncbi:hypothetical protein NQZ68_005037 [Dissostichus eleginoides]|nr:hypothetical protein NQZ68_005037 [Dissostichus eleginoides]
MEKRPTRSRAAGLFYVYGSEPVKCWRAVGEDDRLITNRKTEREVSQVERSAWQIASLKAVDRTLEKS